MSTGTPEDSADRASAPKKRQGANQAGTATQPDHPTSKPPQQAGPVRFGKITTAGGTSDTSIAEDRRALTTTFDNFEVTLDPESAEPNAAKAFAMAMPLTDGAAGETLSVHAQGLPRSPS